ncbi:transposase, partial [Staphylococcus aureus]
FYLELEKQENVLKVQLLETMHQTFPFFEKLFKNRYSTISLNLAHVFPHASMVSDLTKEEITEVISNASLKGMSAIKIENYGDKLIHLANESFPCVSKDHFLVKKVRFVAKSLLHLQEERKHYSQEMINLAQQLPEFEILLSIPGFGRLTTALFIGELGDIRRFSSHKKLNAY